MRDRKRNPSIFFQQRACIDNCCRIHSPIKYCAIRKSWPSCGSFSYCPSKARDTINFNCSRTSSCIEVPLTFKSFAPDQYFHEPIFTGLSLASTTVLALSHCHGTSDKIKIYGLSWFPSVCTTSFFRHLKAFLFLRFNLVCMAFTF